MAGVPRPEGDPEWFGWEYEGLAEEIEMIFDEELEAWKEGGTLHIGGHLFTLDDHDTETVVRVTRAAPIGGSVDWDLYYDDIEEGWTTFLHQLRFALARHPGHTRRTVHLSGFRTGPGAKTTVARLGLAEAAAMATGRRYRAGHRGATRWPASSGSGRPTSWASPSTSGATGC